MSKNESKKTEGPEPSEDEQQIHLEKAAQDYYKLKKDDPRFMGIDLDTKTYWIRGNEFKIKQLGFRSKKILSEIFDKHDDLAKQYGEAVEPGDGPKRIGILQQMDQTKDEIIEKTIPMMLIDDKGGFDMDKWFSDDYPVGIWFDVATDCYLFLRGNGSKEDMLRSMIRSPSV